MTPVAAVQFVEELAATGGNPILGIVRDSPDGMTDAVRRQGEIEWVRVRHEEVTGFTPSAEGQLTAGLTVCAGSCGPCNLHLISGLSDGYRSCVPVLGIALHILPTKMGSGYFQQGYRSRSRPRSAERKK